MKINWKQKLSSRKFWALVAGLVPPYAALFQLAPSVTTQVVALIVAFGAISVYIFAEAHVDKSRNIEQKDTQVTVQTSIGNKQELARMTATIAEHLADKNRNSSQK
jgi:hypothetical protein